MTGFRLLAGFGALALLAACQPAPAPSIATNTGDMREQQMRQIQLDAARSGANPGMQNPVATGVGVGGIERSTTTPGRGNVTAGAPVDLADGYIHLSTAAQVAQTAERHFAGQSDLVLVAVQPDRLGPALRWEPAREGALFPHLYRPLTLADVVWDKSLPLGATGHIFPEGLW